MINPHTVATGSPSKHFSQFGFFSFLLLTIGATLFQCAEAAGPDEWRSRSIYQVITDRYARTDGSTTAECEVFANGICGGTWQGLISHLDYIQDMGFTAIWISPVVTNIPNATDGAGEGYHGFWTYDAETINPNMGTEQDLRDLSQALHDRDMYLMVDLVLNNYAYAGPGQDTVYSDFVPFNKEEYFHPFCYISDYSNDTNAQTCWLGDDQLSLPDLDTENEYVKNYWIEWTNNLMSNYSIDGFRIDAAKHVNRTFWTEFQPAINNTYTVGEALDGEFSYTCTYMGPKELSGVLNYPMWYGMVGTFTNSSNPMSGLQEVYDSGVEYCQDTTLLGTFTENQDQPRFASYTNDTALLANVLTYNMLSDGIPIVYYGAEQALSGNGDPTNREALWLTAYNQSAPLYQTLKAINTARNAIANMTGEYNYWSPYWTWKSKIVLTKPGFLALRKGYDKSIVSIVTNQGTGSPDQGPYDIGDTNFLGGDTLVEVLGCTSQVAQPYGVMTVTVKNGQPQVWVPAEYLVNSTICPKISKSQTASLSASAAAVRPMPASSLPLSSSTAAFLLFVIFAMVI